MLRRVLALFILVFSSSIANAQTLDSTFGDWSVFSVIQDSKKICYVASAPTQKEGNYNKRDEPYIIVTNISKNVDEFSTSSGYSYKVDSEVALDIGGGKFQLFTKGELAWAYDSQTDAKIVQAMKNGVNMSVRGVSKKGTFSLDTYSLKGFTKAYQRMKELCTE